MEFSEYTGTCQFFHALIYIDRQVHKIKQTRKYLWLVLGRQVDEDTNRICKATKRNCVFLHRLLYLNVGQFLLVVGEVYCSMVQQQIPRHDASTPRPPALLCGIHAGTIGFSKSTKAKMLTQC